MHGHLKRFCRFFLPLITFTFSSSANSALSSKPNSDLDVVEIQKYIRERMNAESIPSIAVAVARNGRIVYEEAFGMADRENHISATPRTPFYVASVTKAITGTAIMLLRERNLVDLDRPVNDYLGQAKVHSPMWDASQATVRRVAAHTAGLTTYYRKCPVHDANCIASTDTAIRRYGVLFWPPGDHFDYSNLGYGILGEVISHMSRKPFANFLHDEIFQPLDMQDCFLGPEEKPGAAAQYDSHSHIRTSPELSDTPAASSVRCSVHDLALFGMFALHERLPDQQQILSESSLNMMLDPTIDKGDGDRYGFGWTLQPSFHGYIGLYAQGGTSDSFAVLQSIPSERICVAVLANTGTVAPMDIADRILGNLLPQYRERPVRSGNETSTTQTQHPNSAALAGNWSGEIETWKGRVPLEIKISGNGDIKTRLNHREWNHARDASVTDSSAYFLVQGNIKTTDAPHSPCDLEVELYLRGKDLLGAATTKDGVQLPSWVHLHRPSPE